MAKLKGAGIENAVVLRPRHPSDWVCCTCGHINPSSTTICERFSLHPWDDYGTDREGDKRYSYKAK